MGKGDIKSKRGKITNKSYGARRPRKIKKTIVVTKKATAKKTTVKKASAKKTSVKKAKKV